MRSHHQEPTHKPPKPPIHLEKTFSIPSPPLRRAATLAVVSLLALVPLSEAKDQKGGNGKGKGNSGDKGNSGNSASKGNQGNKGGNGPSFGFPGNKFKDKAHPVYLTHPGSKFKLSKGDGYAGPGYYYGPPNSPYYYARSDVRYFANHGAIPRDFYNQDAYRMNSDDARVQQALARLGYYRGSIDGRFGPQSMRAMNSYQQSQGQQVTGAITAMLLRSLGL